MELPNEVSFPLSNRYYDHCKNSPASIWQKPKESTNMSPEDKQIMLTLIEN